MWPIRLCFYQRLSVSLVAGFLIILSLFMVASTEVNDTMKNESSQRLHVDLAKHLVHDNPILKTGVYDYDALKNLFHTLMVLGPSFEFYFIDPQGFIKTYSKDIGEVALEKIDLAPVKEFINGTTAMPIVGDDPKSLDKQKIFSAEAVYNNDELQGYLYVIIGGERYDTIAQNLKRSRGVQHLVLVIGAGSLFLLFALLLLFRFFTAPLKQLSDDMDEFRAGGFDLSKAGIKPRPWKDDSRNEVQRLGNSFNQMIEHIDMQLRQLKQTDQARKTMLADLSHDLRTPLANLQGFIETLALKGEQISSQERAEFMQISLKNLHNLKHLIDQIFELAYLEGGHVTLKKESIVLAELLHDIAAKFTFKAESKDLKINVRAASQNAYVYVDIGKLERVLTNLIDNAIRHTHAGGSIDVNVSERDQELVVEVKDTGVGISEKELSYIFDARYQASNKEDDAQLHTGLGLAICQKLMILLDSRLEVKSELGKGTSFSFKLSQIKP